MNPSPLFLQIDCYLQIKRYKIMLVEVKPLDTYKWHGKKEKESFSQPKTIQVLYSPSKGSYDTGLTEEEAKECSLKTGLDLSSTYIPEKEHPFWSSKAAQIKLLNATIFFDTTKPLDFVKVKNMKASKYVANSLKEYEEGKWPEATHVIFDEEEQVTSTATKIEKKYMAIRIAMGLSQEEKANLVVIIKGLVLKGKSTNFVNTELDKIIEDDELIDQFLKYAQSDTKDTTLRATILEAIQRNVLTQQDSAIYYMDQRIGFDLSDAVEWFKHPDNQRMKVIVLEKLAAGGGTVQRKPVPAPAIAAEKTEVTKLKNEAPTVSILTEENNGIKEVKDTPPESLQNITL